MRLLLALGLAALLALPLLPGPERAGAALGWCAALALESASLRARLRTCAGGGPLLPALVGGFLARLALLLGGTLLGEFLALWSAVAFLAACAAGLLLGEGVAFLRLGRASGPSDPVSPR